MRSLFVLVLKDRRIAELEEKMKAIQKGEGKNYSTLDTLLLPVGELQSSWYCNRAGLETSSLSHPCFKSPRASLVSGIS